MLCCEKAKSGMVGIVPSWYRCFGIGAKMTQWKIRSLDFYLTSIEKGRVKRWFFFSTRVGGICRSGVAIFIGIEMCRTPSTLTALVYNGSTFEITTTTWNTALNINISHFLAVTLEDNFFSIFVNRSSRGRDTDSIGESVIHFSSVICGIREIIKHQTSIVWNTEKGKSCYWTERNFPEINSWGRWVFI